MHDHIWAEVVDHIPGQKRVLMTRARIPRTERKIDFNVAEAFTDANDETFFAFTIETKPRGSEAWTTELEGCIYPDTNQIFVFDETEKEFVTPARHSQLDASDTKQPKKKKAKAKANPCEMKSNITT